MKEAVGGGWLFTLVIAFVAIFTSFVSLSVNYSKCYKVKDEIISTIQKEHGINEQSLKKANEYLLNIGYRNTGACPKDGNCWYAFSVDNNHGPAGYGNKTNFCVRKVNKTSVTRTNNSVSTNAALGHPESAYYSVAVFFFVDIPVFREVFAIRLMGDTSVVYLPNDFQKVKDGC